VVRFPPAASSAVSVTGNQPFKVRFPSLVSVRFSPLAFVLKFVVRFPSLVFVCVGCDHPDTAWPENLAITTPQGDQG
jgi:hypothetical protein